MRDSESQKNYNELKTLLEQTLSKVQKTNDLKLAKTFLVEMQNRFKGLKLLKEDREELYGKLQRSFAEVNQKISDEIRDFENEAAMNYFNLKTKVEEALFLANNSRDNHETWDFLIEVQSMFRGIKLKREHREMLYAKLQEAFSIVKDQRNIEKSVYEKEIAENYEQVKGIVDDAVSFAFSNEDFRASKDKLIHIQPVLRDARLSREQKDELYAKLNEAFDYVNAGIEEQREKVQSTSEQLYSEFMLRAEDLLILAGESMEFKNVREQLKELQSEVREAGLLREHREELNEKMQLAFDTLGERQDQERNSFLKDAEENRKRLQRLVEKGLAQANDSDKFKETREFLKSIQSEFKGIKMVKEDREELYSRLQSAFQILNERIDEYFRTKRKNWVVRMQFKISEMFTEIEMLKENVLKDKDELSELETQLDIVKSSPKDGVSAKSLEVRIISVRREIERKIQEIERMGSELEDLKNRVEPDDENAE